MPISQEDLPYVSSRVIFDATKKVSCFEKKVAAPHVYRTKEPGNPKGKSIREYSGLSNLKSVDAKRNPDGSGVVIVTVDSTSYNPKDMVAEEVKEADSLKEYHQIVEDACKAAGREDLIMTVYSKVAKLVDV